MIEITPDNVITVGGLLAIMLSGLILVVRVLWNRAERGYDKLLDAKDERAAFLESLCAEREVTITRLHSEKHDLAVESLRTLDGLGELLKHSQITRDGHHEVVVQKLEVLVKRMDDLHRLMV